MNKRIQIALGVTSLWGCSYLFANAGENNWMLFPSYVSGVIGMIAGAGIVINAVEGG